jgi:metal-responsive CopG/Arc/MetJ family transcriptional regulator
MPKKLRNQPYIWDEVKKKFSLTLTSTAIAGLEELASAEGMSRSEFVERIGRKIFTVNTKPE